MCANDACLPRTNPLGLVFQKEILLATVIICVWKSTKTCSPGHPNQGCYLMVSFDTRPLWHNKNIWYNPSTVFRKESLNPLQSLSMSWLLQTIQNARSRIWQTTTATHLHRSLERGLHISHWTLESISTRRRNGIQCPHVYWSSYESSITRPNWD